MKQFGLQCKKEIFPDSRIILKFTFKTTGAWDNCALLAVQNHQLAMTPVISRGQSAHFWKKDCFECLSPHNKVSGRAKRLRTAKIAA